MIKIGITGTRSGSTPYQRAELKNILIDTIVKGGPSEFHHGDCVGGDAEAARMASTFGLKIVCHPPDNTNFRAFSEYDEIRPIAPYYVRNRRIVDETDFLIVMPWQSYDSIDRKGGTWYTHDYAKKVGKPIIIIWPSAINSPLDEIMQS